MLCEGSRGVAHTMSAQGVAIFGTEYSVVCMYSLLSRDWELRQLFAALAWDCSKVGPGRLVLGQCSSSSSSEVGCWTQLIHVRRCCWCMLGDETKLHSHITTPRGSKHSFYTCLVLLSFVLSHPPPLPIPLLAIHALCRLFRQRPRPILK
jgi:hypothetical protein